MTTTNPYAQPGFLRAEMAWHLHRRGHIRSLVWRDTFIAVPRHQFVPSPADGFSQPGWLREVYCWDGAACVPGPSPSAAADLLEALEVSSGQTVLEVGTGPGYTTALLCHRLGDRNVMSIDAHTDTVAQARERLAAVGYHPTVVTAAQDAGLMAGAPYDRIVCTRVIHRVPRAWLYQVRPGGMVVARLGCEMVALEVGADRSAVGLLLCNGVDLGGYPFVVSLVRDRAATRRWWVAAGRPERHQLVVTVDPDGTHRLSVDGREGGLTLA